MRSGEDRVLFEKGEEMCKIVQNIRNEIAGFKLLGMKAQEIKKAVIDYLTHMKVASSGHMM